MQQGQRVALRPCAALTLLVRRSSVDAPGPAAPQWAPSMAAFAIHNCSGVWREGVESCRSKCRSWDEPEADLGCQINDYDPIPE
jgi:hypothetical protein